MTRFLAIVVALGLFASLTRAAVPATQPAERAAALKSSAAKLVFRLIYEGPSDKPFYSAMWGPPPSKFELAPFSRGVITPAQATAVVEWMHDDDLLTDRALNPIETCSGMYTGYTLYVQGGPEDYRIRLGWNLKTLHYLDGMKQALGDGAGDRMTTLISRLDGQRREWESARADSK